MPKIKYKKLTNYDASGAPPIETIVIPAGTIIYRSSSKICDYAKDIYTHKQVCSNTDKCGIYFSTYLFQSLAMALEYNSELQLGVFITKKEIPLMIGKYSFRFLNPKRWFSINPKNNTFIIKQQPLTKDERNMSHFSHNMLPIVNFKDNSGENIHYNMNSFRNKLEPTDGELFITDNEILQNIKLINTYKINLDTLKYIVKENINEISPNNFDMYKEALIPFKCKTLGGNLSGSKLSTYKISKNRTSKYKTLTRKISLHTYKSNTLKQNTY